MEKSNFIEMARISRNIDEKVLRAAWKFHFFYNMILYWKDGDNKQMNIYVYLYFIWLTLLARFLTLSREFPDFWKREREVPYSN